MKVIINNKERTDIIKIDIFDKMIDFETKLDSFYFYFSDIKGTKKIIIKEDNKELIEEFLKILNSLYAHATHSESPFTNLAWVKSGIKSEVKILEQRLKDAKI